MCSCVLPCPPLPLACPGLPVPRLEGSTTLTLSTRGSDPSTAPLTSSHKWRLGYWTPKQMQRPCCLLKFGTHATSLDKFLTGGAIQSRTIRTKRKTASSVQFVTTGPAAPSSNDSVCPCQSLPNSAHTRPHTPPSLCAFVPPTPSLPSFLPSSFSTHTIHQPTDPQPACVFGCQTDLPQCYALCHRT